MNPSDRHASADERRRLARALGELLRQARKRRGLALEEVARVTERSPSHIATWEAGVAVLRLDSLASLAPVLNLALGDLGGLFDTSEPETRYQRFGEALRAARERKGWSPAALAHAMRASEPTWSKWETGRGIPQTWFLPRLARLLGWHLGDLEPVLGASAVREEPDLGDEATPTAEEQEPRLVAAPLGALLRARREELGRSRRQVAERAGVAHANLLSYERGRNAPGAAMLGRLAYALDLDLGDFSQVLSPWAAARRRWEHLGLALRLLRERRGWGRAEMAEEAGVKPAVVRHWEEGTRTPHLRSLGPILAALDLSLGELEEGLDPELPRERRFESLGRALGVVRDRRGIDRLELARRSGISPAIITRWERETLPSLHQLSEVAAALELDLGDLDAALDEAVARERAERFQGVDSVARELARQLLAGHGETSLPVETSAAALIAAARGLMSSALASERPASDPTPQQGKPV